MVLLRAGIHHGNPDAFSGGDTMRGIGMDELRAVTDGRERIAFPALNAFEYLIFLRQHHASIGTELLNQMLQLLLFRYFVNQAIHADGGKRKLAGRLNTMLFGQFRADGLPFRFKRFG